MDLPFRLAANSTYLPKAAIIRAMALIALIALPVVPAAAYAPYSDTIATLMDHIEQQKARLNLTDEQQQQVGPIMETSREQRMSILENYGFGQGSKPKLSLRNKISLAKDMKSVRESTERALAQHLTPNQMAEYKKIQEENRQRIKELTSSH
ncbi:hypothetical protein [Kordiimonas sp.]|uniref:hypothetical protein n=1 Tax=Kordiimonas sp. TaxID=1970157 RepID=UPI003A8FAC50